MRRNSLLTLVAASALCLAIAPIASATPSPDPERETAPPAEKTERNQAPSRTTSPSNQLRLDEITIEGEVDVPRVLFIESRDRLRRAEFLHHLFLRDVTELGRDAPLGHGISWTPHGPNEE